MNIKKYLIFLISQVLAETVIVLDTKQIGGDLQWQAQESKISKTFEWRQQTFHYDTQPSSTLKPQKLNYQGLQVCQIRNYKFNQPPDNWIVSPVYKLKHEQPNITLNFKINTNEPDCSNWKPPCFGSTELYVAEVSNQIEKSIGNTKDYHLIGEVTGPNTHKKKKLSKNTDNSIHLSFTLKEGQQFRLALRDTGSCTAVGPILVSYNFCKSVTRSLSTFPETFVFDEKIKGKCVGYAESKNSLSMVCDKNGYWKEMTGSCQCGKGYGPINGDVSCGACPSNYYKDTVSNQDCAPCPLRSTSEFSGATICTCDKDYYRALGELASTPCTGLPSEPLAVQAVAGHYNLQLKWQPPQDTGFRFDTRYTIDCESVANKKTVKLPPSSKSFTELHYTVEGLEPSTAYECYIMAHNMVTGLKYANMQEVKKSKSVTSIVKKTLEVRFIKHEIIQPSEVKLNWPIGSRMLSQDLTYQITVYPNSEKTGERVTGMPPMIYQASTNAFTLTGLNTNTQYEVEVTQPKFKYLAKVTFRTDGGEIIDPTEKPETSSSEVFSMLKKNWVGLAYGAGVAVLLALFIVFLCLCCQKKGAKDTINYTNDNDITRYHNMTSNIITTHNRRTPDLPSNYIGISNTLAPLIQNPTPGMITVHSQGHLQTTRHESGHASNYNLQNSLTNSSESQRLLDENFTNMLVNDSNITCRHPGDLVGKFAKFNFMKFVNINESLLKNLNQTSVIDENQHKKVLKTTTGKSIAIKILKSDLHESAFQEHRNLFLTNACWLTQFQHENVLQIYHVHPHVLTPAVSLEHANLEMNLSMFISKNCDKIKTLQILKIAKDLASALEYLNRKSVCLVNLTSKSILMHSISVSKSSTQNPALHLLNSKNSDRSVDEGVGYSDTDSELILEQNILIPKIYNFSHAEFFSEETGTGEIEGVPVINSTLDPNVSNSINNLSDKLDMHESDYLKYLPPEIINYHQICKKSDVYSFGLILYELFSKGELPFWNLKFSDMAKLIKNHPKKSIAMNLIKNPLFLKENSEISNLFYDIILHCFHYESIDRISFKSIKRLLTRKIVKINQNSNPSQKISEQQEHENEDHEHDVSQTSSLEALEGHEKDHQCGILGLNAFLKHKCRLDTSAIHLLTKNNYRQISDFSPNSRQHKVEKLKLAELIGSDEFKKLEHLYSNLENLNFKDLKILNEILKKDFERTLPSGNLEIDSNSLDAINEFNIQQRHTGLLATVQPQIQTQINPNPANFQALQSLNQSHSHQQHHTQANYTQPMQHFTSHHSTPISMLQNNNNFSTAFHKNNSLHVRNSGFGHVSYATNYRSNKNEKCDIDSAPPGTVCLV